MDVRKSLKMVNDSWNGKHNWESIEHPFYRFRLKIHVNLRGNQSTNRKMDQNCIFHHSPSDTSVSNNPKIHAKSRRIRGNRLGKWRPRIAISRVVRLKHGWIAKRVICLIYISEKLVPFYRFPFDTENPLGYSVAVLIQYVQSVCSFFITANSAAFMIGSYLLSIRATTYIKKRLKKINKRFGARRNRLELLDSLSGFIKLHSNVKGFSIDFIQFYTVRSI